MNSENGRKRILCFRIMPERNGKRWSVRFLSEPISPSINSRHPCASTQIRKYEKGEEHIFCQFSLILMTERGSCRFCLNNCCLLYFVNVGFEQPRSQEVKNNKGALSWDQSVFFPVIIIFVIYRKKIESEF